MKRLILLALVLASCAIQPPPALVQFTEADLTNAITIAQGSTQPSAPFIVTCFNFLKAQLASLTSPNPPTGTVGLATAFTLADLDLGDVASNSVARAEFAAACGPLIVLTANQGISLSQQIGALGALIAPKRGA